MPSNQLQHLTQTDSWFRYWMPYTFRKLDHSRFKHMYLPLNRNYKPLGVLSDFVHYEDFVGQAIAFSRDPASFKDVWMPGGGGLYLYSDAPASRADYFQRLERLLTHPARLVDAAGRNATAA